MSLLLFHLVLTVLIIDYPQVINGQTSYSTTCTCNTVSSSVCTSYSCTTSTSTSCFAGSSEIVVEKGSSKSLSDIKIGDKVLTNEQNVYEPVIGFIHANGDNVFEFLAIDIESMVTNMSSTIVVSGNHLIFDFDLRKARFAGNFRVGDRLQMIDNGKIVAGEIRKIRLTQEKGYYAPLTPSGTIVVNGVLASNYATVSNHDLAHKMMGMYRLWINVFGPSKLNDEVHWIVELMLNVESIVRWSGAEMLINNHVYDGMCEVSAFV